MINIFIHVLLWKIPRKVPLVHRHEDKREISWSYAGLDVFLLLLPSHHHTGTNPWFIKRVNLIGDVKTESQI